MTVRWTAGAYAPADGVIAGPPRVGGQGRGSFIELLRLFEEQDQHVTHKPCATYAPNVFASHPKAEGIGKVHFKTAMQSLLDKKLIRIDTFGPISHRRQRLVCGSA